jgi:hypothetical protein
MNNMRIVRAFIVFLLFGFGASAAFACSCSMPILNDRDGAAVQFKAASVVFEGEVVSVVSPPPPVMDLSAMSPITRDLITKNVANNVGVSEITFRVLRKYKGAPGETVEIHLDSAGSDCSIHAKAGEKWFVYGFSGEKGALTFSRCSRTNWLEGAGADLRFAKGEPAAEEDLIPGGEKFRRDDPELKDGGATVSGRVRRADGGSVSDVFVAILPILREEHRFLGIETEQKVAADGTFAIRFLRPGDYIVTAHDSESSPTNWFLANYWPVELKKTTKVSDVDLVMYPIPLGTIDVTIAPPEARGTKMLLMLNDSRLWSEDMDRQVYIKNDWVVFDSKGVAHSERMTYAIYQIEIQEYDEKTDGYKLPSQWCQDKAEVNLNGPNARLTVHLHKCPAK